MEFGRTKYEVSELEELFNGLYNIDKIPYEEQESLLYDLQELCKDSKNLVYQESTDFGGVTYVFKKREMMYNRKLFTLKHADKDYLETKQFKFNPIEKIVINTDWLKDEFITNMVQLVGDKIDYPAKVRNKRHVVYDYFLSLDVALDSDGCSTKDIVVATNEKVNSTNYFVFKALLTNFLQDSSKRRITISKIHTIQLIDERTNTDKELNGNSVIYF